MRKRILLAIGGTLLVMFIIISLASRSILYNSYGGLERRYMERDAQRVTSDIDQQTAVLAASVTDYAVWDEMYRFAQRPDPAFAETNFSEDAGENLHINVVIVANREGAVVYRHSFSAGPEKGDISDSLARWIAQHPRLVRFTDKNEKMQGLVALPEGILLVASSPILDNRRALSVGGALVMARLLDDSTVRQLSTRLLLSVHVLALNSASLPDDAARAVARITIRLPIVLDTSRTDTVSAFTVLRDIENTPAVVVRVDSARDIRMQGEKTVRYFFLWLLFIGVGFCGVVLITIERTILARLLHLGTSVLAMGTGGDPSRRVTIRGTDQIAYIGAAINGMLDALAHSTEQLRASERRNEAFLDAIPDVIFRVTRDGTILDARSANRLPLLETANDLVGKDSEQVLPLYSFISPELFEKAFGAVGVALDTGAPQSFVFHVDTDAGRRYYEDRFVASSENEVIVLVREVTDIRKAEEARRKELLLKEIHHRVKNNLQVISSLLALQASATKDASARALLGESRDRVRSMALIHEKLYQSEDERGMSFSAYVRDLVAHLRHSYTGNSEAIETVIDVEEVTLDMDISVPCGLLINELLSNALKYAFPEGRKGTISVRLRKSEGRTLILTVSDDGIGFPPGVNVRSASTLGLRIVNKLVEQLKGTLAMGDGPGTSFTITFPAG